MPRLLRNDRTVVCASLWSLSKSPSPTTAPCLCVWCTCQSTDQLRHQVSVPEVSAGSPSRGGQVTVYVLDINQPNWPPSLHSTLVSISVFVALSTVFYSINSPDNSLLSHSVLLVLFSALLVLSDTYLFMKIYLALIIVRGSLLGWRHYLHNYPHNYLPT